jgi:tRNA-2-methylthio-N6-dimethylallyladenosine synthase
VVTPASLQSPAEIHDPDSMKKPGIMTAPVTADDASNQPDLAQILKDRKTDIPKDPAEIKRFWRVEPHYTSDFEAFIPIQNGCDKFCTFCAVPYTRGREISRPSGEILAELKDLVSKGYKSITLLGQNVNSYGLDKRGDEIPFHELLEEIGRFGDASGKDFWVYFTSPHPRDMSGEVIDVISKYNCLAKQIHLPVQSGDDKVLIRMNRKHNIDRYRDIVRSIRQKIPTATLFTDIIVGFTGETGKQFENTRKIMEEFRFNMAYIAMYSPRPGAASSRWEDDIPLETKKERLQILTEELIKHNRVSNRGLVGKKMQVLVVGEDRKKGYLKALTEGRLIVRFPSADKALIGQFTEVQVNSAADFSLEGENLTIIEELNET